MLCLDYELEIPSLKRLITLSNRATWTPEQIEWTRPLSRRGEYESILEWHGLLRNDYVVSLPQPKREALARQFVACEFSQILHGEQAALMLAGQLTSSVNDLDARIFAANQTRDEARHVQAVRQLLQRIGPIYPCGPLLMKQIVDLLECKLWPKQVLGLQLFLEARALLSFRQTLLFVRDPIFREVTELIERDEAHHVAFGVQYLKTGVDALTVDERKELVAYAKYLDNNVWILMRQEDFRPAFEEVDLDFDECYARQTASFSAPWLAAHKAETVDAMHDKFCRWFESALTRVGLGDALDANAKSPATEGSAAAAEASADDDTILPWIART